MGQEEIAGYPSWENVNSQHINKSFFFGLGSYHLIWLKIQIKQGK